jgi:hypothetical protein
VEIPIVKTDEMPLDSEKLPFTLLSRSPFGTKIQNWQMVRVPRERLTETIIEIGRRSGTDRIVWILRENTEVCTLAVKIR